MAIGFGASARWWWMWKRAVSIAGTDALLEVAAVLVGMNSARQFFLPAYDRQPTCGPLMVPILTPASLEVNKIDPFHPLRIAPA